MDDVPTNGLASSWARAGVLYGAPAARVTPDLEQLLIATARQAPEQPRMHGAAATWLAQYSVLLARHRFGGKIAQLADGDLIATMGLLLEASCEAGAETLRPLLGLCQPAAVAKPLFVGNRRSLALAEWARSQASPLSLRWNLWADVEIRPKIIRPPEWVFGMNPSFRMRAILGGGLRASILACLEWDAPEGASEAELARLCSVTRKALHEAVDHLEFCQFVHRVRIGRCYRITLNRRPSRAAM